MRVLHLPGKIVYRYEDEEIRDLFDYFEPEITVTTRAKRSLKRRIERFSPYETVHLDSIDTYTTRNIGDDFFLFLREESALKQVDFSSCSDGRITVVTDMIKEEMDPKSFYFELTNTSIIDGLHEKLHDFNVLSTEIEAGKKPRYQGDPIYGFGPSFGMGGSKIPSVVTGDRPHIETLNSKKVGILAVPGLGDRFSAELRRRGIETRGDLCSLDPRDILDQDGIGPYRSTKWVSCAKAIEEHDVYRINRDDLKTKHRLFVDIETDSLNPSIIWHIGLYDDSRNKYRSFLEKDPDQKGRIIRRFMDHLEEHTGNNSVLLAWYGSGFDFPHLKSFIKKYDPERLPLWNKIEKIDFMYWTDKHAALPCRSSKLDEVSTRLGYEPALMGLDGEDVARIYTGYMEDRSKEPDWNELLTYAKDDVISMKYVYERVRKAPVLFDINDVKRDYRRR